MRILLQFPEGLKRLAFEEAAKLEKEGHEVFVSSAECFGACDLALEEAKAVGAKKIIHWGHSDFRVKSRIPVEYKEYSVKVDVKKAVGQALPELSKFKKIGLVTTVQHISQLPEIKLELERAGKTVFIGKGSLAKYPGQVLGCDAGAARSIVGEVECIVYFGGGLFHARIDVDKFPQRFGRIGNSDFQSNEKPVLKVDPFSGQVVWMDDEIEKARKLRRGAMNALVLANNVGILITTKPGQKNTGQAVKIKKELGNVGKKCLLLVANRIDFETLKNFGSFDCYVNTACPRIADDSGLAGKPVINFQDAMLVVKLVKR